MSVPFEPLTTEKLKEAFKKMVERNCGLKDTEQCRKKHTDKITGNKLTCPARILETWRQKVINS